MEIDLSLRTLPDKPGLANSFGLEFWKRGKSYFVFVGDLPSLNGGWGAFQQAADGVGNIKRVKRKVAVAPSRS